LELVIGTRDQKTRMMGLSDGRKSFMIDTRPACDRHPDRHTDTRRQIDRTYA